MKEKRAAADAMRESQWKIIALAVVSCLIYNAECGIGGIFVGSGVAEARAGLSSRKRNSTPSSIQRSEEIVPYQRFESGKQSGSLASDTAGSLNSISSSEGSS